jgi:polysaccharide biosynthesis transport protein
MKPESNKGEDRQVTVSFADANLPAVESREPVAEFEDSADLRDYLEIVLRRKWLVLTFLLATFVTVLVVSLSMKPVFKAGGKLELSMQTPKVTKFEDLAVSQLQTREFMHTHVKLLQSESLARRVIEKLQLDQHPIFNPAGAKDNDQEGLFHSVRETFKDMKDKVKGWFQAKKDSDNDLAQRRNLKKIEKWFAENLQVQPERDTTIISLSFRSTDPVLTRDVVNALIHEFIGWQMDKRIDAAGTAKQQLLKQIEQVRIQLEKSEANLNQFAQKAGIVSLDSNLNLVYRQLEEINKALALAEAERISKEALYKQAREGDVGSLTLVSENKLIQQLREEYIRRMAEYEEGHAVFKDDYPKLKTLKAKMLEIQHKIAGEEARIANSIKRDYLTARQREEDLKQSAEERKNLALQLNDRATQYKILDREVESNKQIHQSLLARGKEIDANVGTELGNIQVVDYADQPLKPYKPNIQLNLLLAIVVGLMGGVGLAFFLEYLDNTVKRIDEISDRFRISVLGVVPLSGGEEAQGMDRLIQIKPKSSFSEAIRTAKVSIQLARAMDSPTKTLLITSTNAGEGKSTIASNLAQAFASEEKVLLMDADLRRPRLHKVFSNGNRKVKGLSQFLSGACNAEELLQRTDVPNLYFMAAGPIPPNPAELLASSRMKTLVGTLGKHFDRIIVDGPPYAGFADVLVLSNCVNGVILISTLGQTHREALRIFLRGLHNVHGTLLGSIVNRLNISHQYGGYYYKYYKYYHYHYHPYGDQTEADGSESAPKQIGNEQT